MINIPDELKLGMLAARFNQVDILDWNNTEMMAGYIIGHVWNGRYLNSFLVFLANSLDKDKVKKFPGNLDVVIKMIAGANISNKKTTASAVDAIIAELLSFNAKEKTANFTLGL